MTTARIAASAGTAEDAERVVIGMILGVAITAARDGRCGGGRACFGWWRDSSRRMCGE